MKWLTNRMKWYSEAIVSVMNRKNITIYWITFVILHVIMTFAGVTSATRITLVILGILAFCLELMNTGAESLCDLISPEHNGKVKKAKDMFGAATALAMSFFYMGSLASIAAAVIK